LANGFEDGRKVALCLLAHGVQLHSEVAQAKAAALRGKQSAGGQSASTRNRQLKKLAAIKHMCSRVFSLARVVTGLRPVPRGRAPPPHIHTTQSFLSNTRVRHQRVADESNVFTVG